MVFLSIIIPLIEDTNNMNLTLESIHNQSFNNYEIIYIINDSKIKNSSIIDFIKNDNQIKVYKTDGNNIIDYYYKGIQNSSGEYIIFMNSGDTIDSAYFKEIYQLNKENISMITTNISLENYDLLNKKLVKNYDNRFPLIKNIDLKKPFQYGIPYFIEKNVFKKDIFDDKLFEELYNSKDLLLMKILNNIDSFIEIPRNYTIYNVKEKKLRTFNELKNYCLSLKKITEIMIKNSYNINTINEYLNTIHFIDTPIIKEDEINQIRSILENIIKLFNEENYSDLVRKYRKIFYGIINHLYNSREYDVEISVIIPVYNSEEYLHDCLKSILNQTFKNFEIICINDCSTDNSLAILEDYEKKYDNIKIINNQSNIGSGLSRNIGLKLAKGKYIQFVDADDWIDLNTFEYSYNKMQEYDLDMIIHGGINFKEENNEYYIPKYFNISSLKKYNKKIVNCDDLSDKDLFQIIDTPWNKLYLSSFIKNGGVKFPDNMIHNDGPFFFKCICLANRVMLTQKIFYNRRLHEYSSTPNITKRNESFLLDIMSITDQYINIFMENNLYEKYKKEVLNNGIKLIRMTFDRLYHQFKEKYYENSKKCFLKYASDDKLLNDFYEYLDSENLEYFDYILKTKDYKEFEKKYVMKKPSPEVEIKLSDTINAFEILTIESYISNLENINSGRVSYMINDIWIDSAPVKNRKSRLEYQIPFTFKGTYQIKAVYIDENENIVSKNYKKIKILKSNQNIKFYIPKNIKAGHTININVLIFDKTENFLNNGRVSFLLNNKWIGSSNVKQGIATIKFKVPEQYDGYYPLKATYITKDEEITRLMIKTNIKVNNR